MKMDFGGIILTELNRRIRINIYNCGNRNRGWTDMDSNPVLRCERLASLCLSHGENGNDVLEKNVVSVSPYPLQFPDGVTTN